MYGKRLVKLYVLIVKTVHSVSLKNMSFPIPIPVGDFEAKLSMFHWYPLIRLVTAAFCLFVCLLHTIL